jgi:hypothetical protein
MSHLFYGSEISLSKMPRPKTMNDGSAKKQLHFKPGTITLKKETRCKPCKLKMTAKQLSFQRLVRQIAQDISGDTDIQFESQALAALSEAAEAHLKTHFMCDM